MQETQRIILKKQEVLSGGPERQRTVRDCPVCFPESCSGGRERTGRGREREAKGKRNRTEVRAEGGATERVESLLCRVNPLYEVPYTGVPLNRGSSYIEVPVYIEIPLYGGTPI